MRFTAVNDFSINRWSSRWLQSHATDRAFSRRVTFDPFTHGTIEITLDLRGINARFSLAMAARWNRDELRLARIPNLSQAWIQKLLAASRAAKIEDLTISFRPVFRVFTYRHSANWINCHPRRSI